MDVVRIDVEGHELEVLQGMEGILARGSPHVMLEGRAVAALFGHLETRGYHGFRIAGSGLTPIRPDEVRLKESLAVFRRTD